MQVVVTGEGTERTPRASGAAEVNAGSAAGAARPVAEVVRVLHERTIDVGLAELAIPGLDRDTAEHLLAYCA